MGRSAAVISMMLALTISSPARAADRPVLGAAVGAGVGEVAGLLGGGAIGLGLGAAACSPNAFECWGPLIGAGMGGIAGTGLGGVGGAAVGARLGGGRAGPAALGATVGAGVGIGLLVTGFAIEAPEVGAIASVLAIPAGAAIGASLDHGRRDDAAPSVSVAPVIARGFRGGVVTVRF